LRRHLAKQCAIHKIVNFGYNVFAEPTVHTCIIAIERGPNKKKKVQIHQQVLSPDGLNSRADFTIEQGHLGSGENFAFDIFADPRRKALMRKMSERGTAFGEIYYIRQCIKTGNDREYVSKSRQPLPPPWVPALRGSSIDRYIVYRKDEYLKYGDWLARNWKNRSFYERDKIAVRETGNRIIAALDTEKRYFLSTLYSVYPKNPDNAHDLLYVLGILNSRVATFFIKIVAYNLTQGAFTKVRTNQLARLPFRKINFRDRSDSSIHARMVVLVSRMIKLRARVVLSKTPHEKTLLERQIAATDKEIDRLVYELYGLTEEEIALVESAAK